MAYRIAVASADGEKIDVSFGAAAGFLIYEVADDGTYQLLGNREWNPTSESEEPACKSLCGSEPDSCTVREGCGSGGGCGSDGSIPKLSLIEDCRCILCRKVGFQARKQLEKKAITVFDIEYEIDAALKRIIQYFDKVDHHQNLRGFGGKV